MERAVFVTEFLDDPKAYQGCLEAFSGTCIHVQGSKGPDGERGVVSGAVLHDTVGKAENIFQDTVMPEVARKVQGPVNVVLLMEDGTIHGFRVSLPEREKLNAVRQRGSPSLFERLTRWFR